jgi:hypothetical protein
VPTNDGTGPKGHGPMTGRGRGFCVMTLDEDMSLLTGYAGRDGKAIKLTKNNKESALALEAGTGMKEANRMPKGDRTGPEGMGPMTGRGAGYCADNTAPGYANPMSGRGYGRGMGRGGGRRFMGYSHGAGYAGVPYVTPRPEQELEMLKARAAGLQNELKGVQDRMSDIQA